MTRLPILSPDELSDHQREVSDAIAAKRGGTRGPFLMWLHSPGLAERVDELGAYVRFESSLDARLRELVLLICARHFDAQYSWMAHSAKAVEVGVDAGAIERLAAREEPGFTARDEHVTYAFATELLEDHFVSDATFAAALELFGRQGVVDLIGSMGNFSMLAFCLNAFEVDLKRDRPAPFADVGAYRKVASRLRPAPASLR